VSVQRSFERSFDALEALFAFTAETFAREGIPASLHPAVDFALEELFTNVVKYGGASRAQIGVELSRLDDGVEVTLTEADAERFDPTRAPDADIELPLEERKPGGLGIHLVRRMVDSLEYRYNEKSREARITFRKKLAGAA
jgi:anti-sigma regulatory factor (Ser/Thr protein kinase)